MILFEKGSLRVRQLTDNDASLLAEWLSNPTVLQYYEGRDRPHDLEMVRESFFQQDDETKCIIEYASQPIGYIQFYALDDEGKKGIWLHRQQWKNLWHRSIYWRSKHVE